jgi:multiple sugar transport system permease protein
MSDDKPLDDVGPAEQDVKPRGFWAAIPLPVKLIIPVQAILIFLLIVPALLSIWLSLVSWQPSFGIGIFSAKFVGLSNFVELLTEPRFLWALLRTFYITGVGVGAQLLIGFCLALLCERARSLRKVFILILILPMMFPPLVTGNTFYMLFVGDGPINAILSFVLGRPFTLNWLSSPTHAIYPIMIAEIWQWYPLMFLIMVSGLRGLPPNQLRAAEVLGGSSWQILWRVTIPQLMPIILIAIVIRAMEILKMFDLIYLMTRGGPGTATENINFYMYDVGLMSFRFSYISAGAWILLIISIFVFVNLLKPLLRKVEEFEEKVKEEK